MIVIFFTSSTISNHTKRIILEVFTDFAVPYANASSVLANTLSPLVRDVGIDMMSSAIIVLNLFKVV